jgi:hypothetical protein
MDTSSREKVLILLLPSLVVVIVFAYFFSVPHYRMVAGLEKSIKVAEAAVPSDVQVQVKLQQVASLRQDVDRLAKEEKSLVKTWDDAAALSAASRSDRLTRLLALLTRHDIHVIHHGPFDGGSTEIKDLKLSASQERLLKVLSEQGAKQPPQPRRLHLAGRYGDVARALEALSSGETLAIPMGVILKVGEPAQPVREWWVFLWI